MRKLKLENYLSKKQKEYAVEAALLLGFQEERGTFPVLDAEGEIELSERLEDLELLWELEKREKNPTEPKKVQAEVPRHVLDLDFREKQGLECMFTRGAFLKDEDMDFLPDNLDVKFILPENPSISVLIAACNLAYRFGMETTAYTGRLVAEKDYTGNAVIFEDAEKTEMLLEEQEQVVRVRIRGRGRELEQFSSCLCTQFPYTDVWRGWREVLMDMTDDFVLRTGDGQVARLASLQDTVGVYEVYGNPELLEEQKQKFPEAVFCNYKSEKKVYEKTYTLPWEVEVFKEILERQVYPFVKPGERIKVTGALSEEPKIRQKLMAQIKEELQRRGVEESEIEILCAYKQGFSWIQEVVLPAVQDKGAEKIEIYFKPFLPKGETMWKDENGSLPSYHNLKAEDPEQWCDLHIRYLQELYPVEDILVQALGIQREQVVFLPYEGKEEITYLCRVFAQGSICYENTYQAWYAERPYLEEFPDMGKVHPPTGYIQLWRNGEKCFEQRIPTDLEEIWEIYQTQVLPTCKNYIEEKYQGDISREKQPLFQKLVLEVTASEPDFRTETREDLISSLDALHEDLYFAGSDYLKNYGMKKAEVLLDAPGLILPLIHQTEGAPVFSVALYEPLKEKPCIYREQELICEESSRREVQAFLSQVFMENGSLCVTIQTKGVEAKLLETYAVLLEKGFLERGKSLKGYSKIRFLGEDGQIFEAKLPQQEIPKKTKKITEIDFHEKEVIGYEQYLEIMEALKQVEGIEVFQTAVSYEGRKLYGIWLRPEGQGYLSLTKRLSRIPTEMINARHHANEVSSTNGVFLLLKKLLTEEKYQEVPEKLNLLLVPMENTDGTAIHYELQKEHPYWKLHVARFNVLGKEFAHAYFQQDTLHTEAMGLTRLYEKFAPDIMVDNHGVPSHEWEQPFSGYTSPSYKGFWLPRSLLYGYFWYVTNPEFQESYALNKKMEEVIAEEIAKDEEMTAWNHEWSAQFEKYAHAWLPKLFPAEYYKSMINYWIPYEANPNHTYSSIRFPWITSAAYTSETADETAQGDYLYLCARAHAAHDEAIIQMLLQAKHRKELCFTCREGRIFARYLRQRPILV